MDGHPGSITAGEIATQPEMWSRALDLPDALTRLLPGSGERVVVIGCGTSFYIGDAYAYLRGDAGFGPTRAAIPRELTGIDDDEHIIVISRSGTTADVVDVVERFRATHRVTAILGDVDTPLGALCDRVVPLGFADERSIVQTRFATTVLTTLRASIDAIPSTLIDDACAALEAPLPVDPERLRQTVFLGHRWTVGVAHEAALKVRESAGAWTEAYPVWEYQHGPISCAGPGSLVWGLGGMPELVAADVRTTGAVVHTDAFDPQASLVLAHRLALELALGVGRDPDHPPFLGRSVLVTG